MAPVDALKRMTTSREPCIAVVLENETLQVNVYEYEAARHAVDSPDWARDAPPVEQLTTGYIGWRYRATIIDRRCFRDQLWTWLGRGATPLTP